MKRFFQILVLLFAVSISSAFAQKTYKVGDYYNDGTKEGVVFWVDKTGRNGKIVSLDEAQLPWMTVTQYEKKAHYIGVHNYYDGKSNTDKVMARSDSAGFPVFVWCRNKGKDWYLPSLIELSVLLSTDSATREIVNNQLERMNYSKLEISNTYWSSTEITKSYLKTEAEYLVPIMAHNYNATDELVIGVKTETSKVRAVANFGDFQIVRKLWEDVFADEATSSATAKTYKVGDYYNDGTKEGVVFYVDATGQHGKIVSMQQTTVSWSSNDAEQRCCIGASSKTDGRVNMKVVMGRPNWKANYPAFSWCANLGEGWYLPAIDELEKFTLNDAVRNAVNRTLAAKSGAKLSNESSSKVMWYWSSTEREYQYPNREYSAQLISMDAATIGRARKSVQGPTRAVAQF